MADNDQEVPRLSHLDRRLEKNTENCEFIRRRLRELINEKSYFSGYPDFINLLADYLSKCKTLDDLNSVGFSDKVDIELDRKKLSEFVAGGKDSSINDRDYGLIVYYLDDIGELTAPNQGEEIEQKFSDSLFHALLHFMNVGPLTVANVKRRAPGLYQAWRPSSSFPGMFWKGLLHIYVDEDSQAVKVEEFYSSAGEDGRYDREIYFSGYLLKKASQYVIVARNRDLNSMQPVMLPEVTVFNHQVHSLGGFVMDMTTSRLYNSRIFYDLLVNGSDITSELLAEHKEYLGMVNGDSDEFPASIRAFFDRSSPPNINLF